MHAALSRRKSSTRGSHPGTSLANRISSDKLSKPVSRSRIGSTRRWESKRRRSSIGARNWIHVLEQTYRVASSRREERMRERERIFRDGAYSLFYTFMTRTFMHSLLRSRKRLLIQLGGRSVYTGGGEVGWR